MQQATLGHRGRKHDPLYRARKLLLARADRLDARGWSRLSAALAAGDPAGEVTAAWQVAQLVRGLYAAPDLAAARRALELL